MARKVFWLAAPALGVNLAWLGMPLQKEPVSFEKEIAPIFKAHCLSCHTGDKAMGGLDLAVPKLSPIQAKEVVRRVKGLGGKPQMPMGFGPLSNSQIAKIEQWVSQGASTAKPTTFLQDVLPIFKAHCATCHSGAEPKAGLNLVDGVSLRNSSVVNLKKSEQSLLLKRLKGLDGLPQMPMGFGPLSNAQIETVRKWIAGGAMVGDVAEKHWAYVAPKRPSIPLVKNKAWVRNPIDNFVLSLIEKKGLAPSPRASKETLIRRLSLDLTGLPPTPEEVTAFLRDNRAKAYEILVDRLLASPHYGERMARPWLDLARYADTHGYEKDGMRTAWKYRDWVIEAFNKNMPYDEFTTEQIAGDLIPGATLDQRIATGFQRNTMLNMEGGVDQAEAHFNVVIDRVGTTSTVFMGSTLACARCHDHKFDPFSQKDFYKMYAYFGNTKIVKSGDVKVSEEKWSEPVIEAPTEEQLARRKTLLARVEQLKRQPTDAGGYEKWKHLVEPQWQGVNPTSLRASNGTTLHVDKCVVTASGTNPDRETYILKVANVSELRGLQIEPLGNPVGRASSGNFVLTGVKVLANGVEQKISTASADFIQEGYNLDKLLAGDKTSGWAVYPQANNNHRLILEFDRLVRVDELQLEFQSHWPQHGLRAFRVSSTAQPFAGSSLYPASVQEALKKGDDAVLRPYYNSISNESRLLISEAEKELAALNAQIATAMVLEELPSNGPLTAMVYHRGEFLSPTERVVASPPSLFSPRNIFSDRLGLAKWLVDPSHPLTARVQVNRLWELLFGRGLVETSEDFGTQGSRPTHPELLDWLATEFVKSKWDMKAMIKKMVMSATYRQSSNTSNQLVKLDPQNVFLARSPRYRMEAEMIRDAALSVSGLLSPTLGGPSVYPYQPDGIWDSPYSGERWMTSQGAELYRRSVYTFWKRTAPYPAFMAFDATSRESCTPRRSRTNTPLQALALLNDPSMIEAAKALGSKMKSIADGFYRCTSRQPTKAEADRLMSLANSLLSKYRAVPESWKLLGATTEQATNTMVANALLNLDETITRN